MHLIDLCFEVNLGSARDWIRIIAGSPLQLILNRRSPFIANRYRVTIAGICRYLSRLLHLAASSSSFLEAADHGLDSLFNTAYNPGHGFCDL